MSKNAQFKFLVNGIEKVSLDYPIESVIYSTIKKSRIPKDFK
jgi:hypothetical protein